MIDYFALALGHGLLAIALLRLVMRPALDEDPLIGSIKDEAKGNRKAVSIAARNAARRGRDGDEAAGSRSSSGCEAQPQAEPVAPKRT